jgi:branched-chain amino acid transport system ATP-binding protein
MLLEIRDLHAGYGALDVLRGLSLDVDRGELVAVLGPNGAGKSTLLRAISRMDADVRSGAIRFDGHDLLRASTEAGVRFGCLHVPEGRQLFTELSVDDNLRLGAYTVDRSTLDADVAAIYERFPPLAQRRTQTAFALSGGEQQMLAIGRALMARPKLLMLDEPSTGLAPQIVEQIFGILADLKRGGTALLVVEQNAYLTLQHADRAYVLEGGSVALAGTAAELAADPRVRAIYLGGSVT